MTLDTCCPNEVYQIDCIHGSKVQRQQLYYLGFLEGSKIRCVFTAPSGDPIAFEIQGSVFALRKQQLKALTVHREEN